VIKKIYSVRHWLFLKFEAFGISFSGTIMGIEVGGRNEMAEHNNTKTNSKFHS
jgi:hypothetical protein